MTEESDGWRPLLLEHEMKRATLEFDLAQREFDYIRDYEKESSSSGRYQTFHARMIAANERFGRAIDAYRAWQKIAYSFLEQDQSTE
jgi:hypothetical protein